MKTLRLRQSGPPGGARWVPAGQVRGRARARVRARSRLSPTAGVTPGGGRSTPGFGPLSSRSPTAAPQIHALAPAPPGLDFKASGTGQRGVMPRRGGGAVRAGASGKAAAVGAGGAGGPWQLAGAL